MIIIIFYIKHSMQILEIYKNIENGKRKDCYEKKS